MMEEPNPEYSQLDLNDLKPRNYQIKLMEIALQQNTIIFLPTGSGKTLIAVMIMKQLSAALQKSIYEGGKLSIMLVNTVALVEQHSKYLRTFVPFAVGAYSGDMNVDAWQYSMWKKQFEDYQILVMTSQILVNILEAGFLSINNINVLIFDECHHAVDDHPMRQIMIKFQNCDEQPRVVGLTATLLNKNCTVINAPYEIETLEVTLHSKIATVDDLKYIIGYSTNPQEVITYFNQHDLTEVEIWALKELQQLIAILDAITTLDKVVEVPQSNVYKPSPIPLNPAKALKDLINFIKDAIYHIKVFGIFGGKIVMIVYAILLERIRKHCQEAKMMMILEAILTSFNIVQKTFENTMKDYNSLEQIQRFSSQQVLILIKILKEFKTKSPQQLCSIIFVERRFTAKIMYHILKYLNENDLEFKDIISNFVVGFNTNPFSDTREGLYNSKMCKKVLHKFCNHEFNVMVASNVLEEGVDIPTCSMIINFDKPTNYRAYIQSKGRARHKDSLYYIMVPNKEEGQFKKKYESFQNVEDILYKYLVGQNLYRTGPSDENINELYNERNIPPYCVNGVGSAEVTILSAISLLCKYCKMLPSDKYTSYEPNWYLEEDASQSLYRVVIELPLVSSILEKIEGPYCKTKKLAKRAAALKACEILHKAGELDDRLMPKKRDIAEEDVNHYFAHWPKQAGKKLDISKYGIYKKSIPFIYKGVLQPDRKLYLHVIKLTPLFTPVGISDNWIHQLYSSNVCFGILSMQSWPKICQFSVYQKIGEVVVNIEINKTVTLTAEQIMELKQFHYLIFNDILKLLKDFLIFDNDTNAEGIIIVPLDKANDCVNINFDILKNHKELIDQKKEPRANEKLNLVVTEENFLGKIVTPWYRNDDKQYLVVDICRNLDAFSKFPSDDFDTYANYFNDKYHTNILNPTQPLLLVKAFSKKMIVLKPHNGLSGKRKREKVYEELEEHLIPELCVKQEFPACLWLQAILLPSILYRISTLLLAEELRRKIVLECGLGLLNLSEEEKWLPLIPDDKIADNLMEEIDKKKPKVLTDETDNCNLILSQTAIKDLNNDFASKKLELEYPWLEKDEPIDIERHIHINLMDIQYYENFISQKVELTQRIKRNEIANRKNVPAITFDRDYIFRNINLLKPRINKRGPELVDIFTALTTTKCGEVVNFERLETLGDSFLKIVVSLFIVLRYPKYNEGKATAFKSKLISNKNLCYIGIKKNICGYIKMSSFMPSFDWKPPSFCIPKFLLDKIKTNKLSATALFNFHLSQKEQLSGVWDKKLEQDVLLYEENTQEEQDQGSYDSMLSFLDQHDVKNKSIADSVEAFIGVYFQTYGFRKALIFLEWLELFPKVENIGGMLEMEIPNPILKPNATSCNIDFYLPSWKKIEEVLKYNFKNPAYLLQALTHASYTPNRITNCYQTLEFLGDAVLDFLITSHIYETSQNLDPGDLTDLRSALVNNIMFACFTVRCGFHKFLLFSNGKLLENIQHFVQYQEEKQYSINEEVLILLEEGLYLAEHVDVPKVLGDIFESLAGAVFLDSGMNLETVWEVFYRIMWKEIELFKAKVPKNVIRLLHETVGAHPQFQEPKVIDSSRIMIPLDIMLNGAKKRVYGFGENKILAKKAASKIALRLLQQNDD